MSVRTKVTLVALPTMMLPYGIGQLLFVLLLSAIMSIAIESTGRTHYLRLSIPAPNHLR